jgi:hypothetical protein
MKYKHEDSLLAFLKTHDAHELSTIIKNIFPSFLCPVCCFGIPGNKELIAILYTHNDYDDDDERGLHTLDIHV